MPDENKPNINPKLKAFATNAVTEILKTESDAQLPISSDRSVEEAREWCNDGNKL